MLKFLFFAEIAFVTLYGLGESLLQHPKIAAFVIGIENGYGSLNQRLKDVSFAEGIRFVKKLYGLLGLVCAALFFLALRISIMKGLPAFYLACATIYLGFAWFSISWCLEHKATIRKASHLKLLLIGPLILSCFDYFLGTPFTSALANSVYEQPLFQALNIPRISNPFLIGLAISVFFLIGLLVYYILTWLIAGWVTVFSALLVLLPIYIAKGIHRFFPKKAFTGFISLVTVISVFAPGYLPIKILEWPF